MSKLRAWRLFALFFLFSCQFYSQISQNSGPVNACAPANITFTAPAGATSIIWNFGAFGTYNTSTGAFNVLNPTSFNATFSGMVGGNPVTFTVPVNVYAKPTVSFSISQPSTDCVVKTVTLTDQSTSSNTIASWYWVYGDGGSGTSSGSHTHGYTFPGSYSVTLKVTDIYGCDNQLTKGTILVTTSPVAVISSNPSNLSTCDPTLSAAFSASNSTGQGTITYNWSLGNGQTSTQMSPPAQTYTAQTAPYVISLTVTANGCSNVSNTFVSLSPPTLSVTVPATVCPNAAPVVTIQSNQLVTNWNLGNSTSTNIITPSPSAPTVAIPAYTAAGNYTIVVTSGFGNCTLAPVSIPIFVDNINAQFTSPTPYISCDPTRIVTFSNQTTGSPVQYKWYYTDYLGTVIQSTQTNPTFTFSVVQLNQYKYKGLTFNPKVFLVATSAAGCRDTFSIAQYTISRPVAWFYKDKREGCSPLIVTFSDTSYSNPPNPITSYTWNNGATPPVTVSGTGFPIPKNTFTYNTIGIYRPYLIVKTSTGCVDTSFIDTVIVAAPPTVSFSFTPSQVCPGQTVQIVNSTTNAASVQHWHVESDNGYFSGCVNDPNPTWMFTNVGTHTFALSGYINGCKGRAVSTQSLLVKGPIVKGRFETNCTSPKTVGFEATMQNAQTCTINFGDNSSATFTPNASGIVTQTLSHTYSVTGNYSVVVTADNSLTGCAASVYTMMVRVRQIQASITGPPLNCVSTGAVFSGLASVDVYTTCSRGYVWYVDNLPPTDDNTGSNTVNFTSTGTHTVKVVVGDVNGCQANASTTIYVSDVTPTFSLSKSTICLSNPTVQMVNSTQNVPDTVILYHWTFGDGQTLDTNIAFSPTHTFLTASGPSSSFTVGLTATNNKGCQRYTAHIITVVNPDAGFQSSTPGTCLPANTSTNITFVANLAYPSYTYNYGTGPTATAVTTFSINTYTFMPGSYTVTMKVVDQFGCTNTGSLMIYNTQVPQANFIIDSPGSSVGDAICSPNIVKFTNVSYPPPTTAQWSFPPGAKDSTNSFPVDVTSTSVFVMSLTVNSGPPYYCTSSTSKTFTVYVAKADIVLSKTVVCLGDQIKFNIDSTGGGGLRAWVWDYGDASVSPTVIANTSPPSFTLHTYTNYTSTAAGNTTASLIYWSSGDACKYAVQKPIKIVNVVPGFLRNNEISTIDSIHCLKVPDLFSSTAVTNTGGQLTYAWILPGGISGSDSTITHTFPTDGVKQVTLTVKDQSQSCSATAVKGVTILPLPTATVETGEFCPDRPFTLTVNVSPGVVSGTWSPVSGMLGDPTFTTSAPVVYSQAQTGGTTVYSLNVTDNNTCVSETITREVKILLPAPHVDWDTSIVIGEFITLNGNLGQYTYTWSPEIANLSCTLCANPITTTTNNITYTVMVEDLMHCAIVENFYHVEILPRSSVDVPSAFTPNGDGRNDVIYVDGWGIKKLNYFRIYNRWGELLFESNDINVGWDGTFKGVPQNMETYVYEVSVQSYIDSEPLTKSSTFKLLR